jgi:hypothetical protein
MGNRGEDWAARASIISTRDGDVVVLLYVPKGGTLYFVL